MTKRKRALPGQAKRHYDPFHIFISVLLGMTLMLLLLSLVQRLRNYQILQAQNQQLQQRSQQLANQLMHDLMRTTTQRDQCNATNLSIRQQGRQLDLIITDSRYASTLDSDAVIGSKGLGLSDLTGLRPNMLLQLCYQQEMDLLLVDKTALNSASSAASKSGRITFQLIEQQSNQLSRGYPKGSLVRSGERISYQWTGQQLQRQTLNEGAMTFPNLTNFLIQEQHGQYEISFTLATSDREIEQTFKFHWQPWYQALIPGIS